MISKLLLTICSSLEEFTLSRLEDESNHRNVSYREETIASEKISSFQNYKMSIRPFDLGHLSEYWKIIQVTGYKWIACQIGDDGLGFSRVATAWN